MPRKNNLKPHRYDAIAGLWGFAEATLFFIIPDVFITYRSMSGTKHGLRAAGLTLIGALVGGTLMYFYSVVTPAAAIRLVDAVPTITAASFALVHQNLADMGAIAIIFGPWQTLAYKMFAVLAPYYDIEFWQFFLISIPARLMRFVAVALIAGGLVHLARPHLSRRLQWIIFGAIWVAIYTTFFINHWI